MTVSLSQSGGLNLPKLPPDDYADMYAKKNGISEEQAKVELQEKYGTPQPPQQEQTGQSQGEFSSMDTFEAMEMLLNPNVQAYMMQGNAAGQQGPHREGDYNPTGESKETKVDTGGAITGSAVAYGADVINSYSNSAQSEMSNPEGQAQTGEKPAPPEGMDPNKVAQEYMDEWNKNNPNDPITFEEAKETLEEIYSEVQQ